MPERRQAFRREPIEIDLDDKTSISVAPVPWQQRNDFGDEVVRQHVQITNEAVKIYVDEETGIPQLEMKLAERFTDAWALFKLGLNESTVKQLWAMTLYQNQIIAILLAILEVNELEKLKPMIDPNSQSLTSLGGLLSTLNTETESGNGVKNESTPVSSSVESTEEPSVTSPTLSSVPS